MKKNAFLLALLLSGFTPLIYAAEFGSKLDTSFRFDDRSGKDHRFQYRLRVYPYLKLGDQNKWSINGFAVTGDDFASSHNTLDDNKADHFYLRRLYIRYQNGENKTEFGVLPTYKGRVSSTGLSKDGFISGLRQVIGVESGKIELVVGDLDDTDASRVFESIDSINYAELEYSSYVTNRVSFELSTDHVLGRNYARAELRFGLDTHTTYAFEVIKRLDQSSSKIVISLNKDFELFDQTTELFAYYSHVDSAFGPRAELTEDFLATGHGLALELESKFSESLPVEWFAKFEAYEGNSRIQLGIKYSFSL